MHVNKHDTTILDEIVRETDATRKDAYHISVYIYIYIYLHSKWDKNIIEPRTFYLDASTLSTLFIMVAERGCYIDESTSLKGNDFSRYILHNNESW